MIRDTPSFLQFFDGVHRRTLRDVSSLPPAAETWIPPAGEGEAAWGAPEIVGHIAEARLFYASAFLGRGWVWDRWPEPLRDRGTWAPVLEESAARFVAELRDVPGEWLRRRIELIGQLSQSVSGWRVLMMAIEHEVHHRSQLATYAGLNGWPVHQIFGRTNEWVVDQREAELRTRPEAPA